MVARTVGDGEVGSSNLPALTEIGLIAVYRGIHMTEPVISRDLTEATNIELVEKLPEEVTGTTMRKFCFRRVDHNIIVVYLENKNGQSFELKIDESTSRAITRLFDEHKTKIPKT